MKKNTPTTTHTTQTLRYLDRCSRAKQNEWIFHERMNDFKLLTAQFIECCRLSHTAFERAAITVTASAATAVIVVVVLTQHHQQMN